MLNCTRQEIHSTERLSSSLLPDILIRLIIGTDTGMSPKKIIFVTNSTLSLNMNFRMIGLTVCILLVSGVLPGQPKSHIVHYGLQDGLPQRSVMNILQDSKGRMWFATWGDCVILTGILLLLIK